MKRFVPLVAVLMVGLPAFGQSSSLYVTQERVSIIEDPFDTVVVDQATGEVGVRAPKQANSISHAVRAVSYAAVTVPEPRTYQKHDIVTIIVRESTTADIDASLSTEKDASFSGEVAAFPDLVKLLQLQLKPYGFPDGTPQVDVGWDKDFEGDGDYSHSTEMMARLAARVIDVKPNGLLTLEARKFIENDDETMTLVVTGTCQVDDIEIDNTVVSSSLFDLHISKQHTGELRKSTKKGLLTNIMDFLFNI